MDWIEKLEIMTEERKVALQRAVQAEARVRELEADNKTQADAHLAHARQLAKLILELEAERDLRAAQLLMVSSELHYDGKIDTRDSSDPRWTPALYAAAGLKAEIERLNGQRDSLQRQARDLTAGRDAARSDYMDLMRERNDLHGEVERLTPLAADAAGALERVRAVLAPVFELEAQATPGPWDTIERYADGVDRLVDEECNDLLIVDAEVVYDYDGNQVSPHAAVNTRPNARLIRAARNALPELRAALASPPPAELCRYVRDGATCQRPATHRGTLSGYGYCEEHGAHHPPIAPGIPETGQPEASPQPERTDNDGYAPCPEHGYVGGRCIHAPQLKRSPTPPAGQDSGDKVWLENARGDRKKLIAAEEPPGFGVMRGTGWEAPHGPNLVPCPLCGRPYEPNDGIGGDRCNDCLSQQLATRRALRSLHDDIIGRLAQMRSSYEELGDRDRANATGAAIVSVRAALLSVQSEP